VVKIIATITGRIASVSVGPNGAHCGIQIRHAVTATSWAIVTDAPDRTTWIFRRQRSRASRRSDSVVSPSGRHVPRPFHLANAQSFTVSGSRRDVPPDAKPYVIEGDRYVNAWLGTEVTKPAGFRFVELDETWPATTIVGMERGSERDRLVLKVVTGGNRRPVAPT
jgi:hypothetical protein